MIVVIQAALPHYRRAFMNELCRLGPVTVIHSGKAAKIEGDRFEEVILPTRSIGPFRMQLGLADTVKRLGPDAVIAMFDVRWITTMQVMYRFDRKIPWVWWGLDYGKSAIANRMRIFFARRENAIVFYDKVARSRFFDILPSKDRLFVANNTFHVDDRSKSYLYPDKNRFINVGTLDARKQNDVTIRVLARIIDKTESRIKFTMIGDGVERERLGNLISSLGLKDRVELIGSINDPKELKLYYDEALASVSFGQAGLAVLQSMAFGVPFVTKKNAVSGGEVNNIINEENGILCDDSPESLEKALVDLIDRPEYARNLGKEAFEYYSKEATVHNMVVNFERAIEWRKPR